MIDQVPQIIQIFILSMIPGIESRYVIPYAMFTYGYTWQEVFPIAVIGNMILVPFGLLFFRSLENYLQKYQWCKNIMDKVFPKIRKRANKMVQRYVLEFLYSFPDLCRKHSV